MTRGAKGADGWTDSQRSFLKNYNDPDSPTYHRVAHSAMKAWPGSTKKSAQQLAYHILKRVRNIMAEENALIISRAKESMTAITPNYIIDGLKKEAESADKSADRIRALELLGRLVPEFRDMSSSENASTVTATLSQSEIDAEYTRLALANRPTLQYTEPSIIAQSDVSVVSLVPNVPPPGDPNDTQ